jgi:hypothetical protein
MSDTLEPEFSLVYYKPELLKKQENFKFNDPVLGVHSDIRGSVNLSEIVQIYPEIKKKINFFDFTLDNLTTSVIPDSWFNVKDFSEAYTGRAICKTPEIVVHTLQNTTSYCLHLSQLNHQFDTMYAERAYLHWHFGEALESGEMSESRENMAALERDYENNIW